MKCVVPGYKRFLRVNELITRCRDRYPGFLTLFICNLLTKVYCTPKETLRLQRGGREEDGQNTPELVSAIKFPYPGKP